MSEPNATERILRADAGQDLNLFECGKEKCCPIKDIVSFAKPYHVLHFVLNGKGFLELGQVRYELGKGDFFYIPPHLEAHYYPDAKEPWTYTWIGFSGETGERFLRLCGISPQHPVFSAVRDNSLNDFFNELVYHYNHVGYLDIECLGYAYILFARIAEHRLATSLRALTPKESHVKEAKEFIAYNFQFPITVQNIADSVNLSTNYLSNIFQETLGISPKQYLTKYRMDRACVLLSDGQMKIKDIAPRVGYKNQLHFSGEFKKIKGLSPKFFQEKMTKRNERRHE